MGITVERRSGGLSGSFVLTAVFVGFVVVGVLLVTAVYWLRNGGQWMPGFSSSGAATKTYWTNLLAAVKQEELPSQPASKTLAEAIAQAKRVSEGLRSAGNRIRQQPMSGVDGDVTAFAGRLIKHFDGGSNLADRMRRHLEEIERFQVNSTSVSTLAEAFIRGFIGDPFGKTREISAEGGQLDAKTRELMQESEMFDRATQELASEEITLRVALNARYGSSFEALELTNHGR